VHLLPGSRFGAIFVSDDDAHMHGHSVLAAQLIMPPVHELLLPDEHQVVQQSRVLQVEELLVLSDYDHVVAFGVVVGVGSGVIGGLEVLKQHDYRLLVAYVFL
jgi:hypothetical protein